MINPLNDKPFYLVVEKLEEFDYFMRFLELNPDVKERYEAHKTYEILNNDN
jgi:ribosome biogenesis protein Tsr3